MLNFSICSRSVNWAYHVASFYCELFLIILFICICVSILAVQCVCLLHGGSCSVPVASSSAHFSQS